MLLYYIRHGDPIYDPDSLTELGHKQAEALSERLAKLGLDEIYCSTTNRAQQTAAPTAQKLGLPVRLLDWCNESYVWEEFTTVDECGKMWFYQDENMRKVMASQQVEQLGAEWYNCDSFADTAAQKGVLRIRKETSAFLSSLGYDKSPDGNYYTASNPNEKRIALFAHEGFGMAFLSVLLGISYPTFCLHFALEHSSMTVIQFDGTDFVVPCVLQLSNDSHLYKSGLPTNYNNGIAV